MVGTLRPPRAAGPAAGSVPLGLHYPMCAEPMQPNRTQSRRHRPRTRDPPDTDLVTPTRGGTLWFFRDPWRDSMVLPRPVEALYGSGCTPWRRQAAENSWHATTPHRQQLPHVRIAVVNRR